VSVYGPDNVLLYTYETFQHYGVYPVLLSYQGQYYVISVQSGVGRFVYVHQLHAPSDGAAEQIAHRRLSPHSKYRRVAVGQLDSDSTPEVVFSTIRGNVRYGRTRRLKVYDFRPNRQQKLRLQQAGTFALQFAARKIGNQVTIEAEQFVVIRNKAARILFIWKPYLRSQR
jgi:hypothetical protein